VERLQGIASAWRVAAITSASVAVGLTLVVPVWNHGDDSGRYSCGGLLWKRPQLSELCEYDGAYRSRVVLVGVLAAVALACAAVAVIRGERSTRSWAAWGGSALAVTGLSVGLWFANDAHDVPTVYDYEATTVSIDTGAIVPGPVGLGVHIEHWPSPIGAMIASCTSGRVPDDCDMIAAALIGEPPPDPATPPGVIDDIAYLTVAPESVALIAFDREMLSVPAPWPRGSYVTVPLDP
jgi:hypothetical protein